MAARSYFKKPASDADADRGRVAGRPGQGPGLFQPRPLSASARASASPMCSSACRRTRSIGAEQVDAGVTARPRIVPYERPRRDTGFHFVDHLMREAQTLVGMQSLTVEVLHGALDHQRQAAARRRGGVAGGPGALRAEQPAASSSDGPEINLGETVMRVNTEQSTRAQRRGRVSSRSGRSRCRARGCRSTTCTGRRRSCSRSAATRAARSIRVGLHDGRILPLSTAGARRRRAARRSTT